MDHYPGMVTHAALHHFLLTTIIETGQAPDMKLLMQRFEVGPNTMEKALIDLQEYHGLVLHPNSVSIRAVHPFSLVPTPFVLYASNGKWWGNCAWCALGAAVLLQGNVTIATRIAGNQEPVLINKVEGEIEQNKLLLHFPVPMTRAWENVVFTCSTMLVFRTVEEVEEWSAQHGLPVGDIQPLSMFWHFAKEWYGNHLNPNWEKWTIDEAREMFQRHHLTHPIWNLEESADRF